MPSRLIARTLYRNHPEWIARQESRRLLWAMLIGLAAAALAVGMILLLTSQGRL